MSELPDRYANVSPDTLEHFGINPARSKVKSPLASLVSVPAGTTKQTFRRVVAGAVMAYQMHKKAGKGKTLPTIEEIVRISGVTPSKVNQICATDEFRHAMRERGIFWTARDALTPEQTYAIGILTNPADRRDMAGKLKAAGIDYGVYRNWLKQPLFAAAIKQIGEDMLQEHISDVHTALTSKAVGGDIRAMELYYQISGRFDPAKEQQHDINRMVMLLLEVLFRHVTDTTTLEKINNEFTMVLSGETPVASLPVADIVDAEVKEETAPVGKQELAFDLPEGIEVNERELGNDHSDSPDRNSDRASGGFAVEKPLVDQVLDENGELPPGFFDFYEGDN